MARIDITDLLLEALSVEEIGRNSIRVSIVVQILAKLVSGIRSVSWGGKLRALSWNQVHYPTKTLADKTGLDRETVTRHLKFLEQFGFIETESHTRDGTIITLTMLSAPIDAAIHPAIDAPNHATISATNDGAALRRKTPLEIPLSNTEEKNIIIAREGWNWTRDPANIMPTIEQINECWKVYCDSLRALGIPPKNAGPHHQSTLARAIAYSGFEDVRDALEGVRYETKSGDFDPKKHVSLDYCLHRNSKTGKWNLERLGNIARMKRQAQDDRNGAYS